MLPLEFTITLTGISIVAGFFGSLLGLGGGVLIAPVLTLLYHIDIRYAIGASIVSLIDTSSGAAAAYVREHMANIRVAMWLELGTTTGAISGAYLAGILHSRWLFIIFGLMMAGSALAMLRHSHPKHRAVSPDPWADRLRLHGNYFDEALGLKVADRVTHSRSGLLLMCLAGLVSGLLGNRKEA